MRRKDKVVCSSLGFLGILSAATGFAAEATKIKGSQVQLTSPSTCTYPSTRSPAMGLGLTAAWTLVAAHIIINATSGCCCKRGPHQSITNWASQLICYVVSWFTYIIAFVMLLTSAELNDQHGGKTKDFGNYYCYVVKPGVFAGAAILSLASVFLGIAHYLLNVAKNKKNASWVGPAAAAPNQAGIAMGQP